MWLFTLYWRWRNKEQLSKAHKKHAYQRLTQGGWSHLKVDLWAIGFNLILIGATYLLHNYYHFDWIALAVLILVLFGINARVDKILPFKKD